MKKWWLLEVIVIVLIAGGIGAWYFSTHKLVTEEPTPAMVPLGAIGGTANTNTTVSAPVGVSHPPAAGYTYQPGNLLLGRTIKGTTPYLLGFNGRVVYSYDRDTAAVSNCTGECASIWPPYTITDTSGLGNLQSGVNGKVGTIQRADGSLQVTYNGKPLYYHGYADTDNSGPVGDGIDGVWHLVTP